MNIDGITGGKGALNGLMQSRLDKVTAEMEQVTQRVEGENDDKAAGKAFESYFASMLVTEMRKSLPEGFFSGAGSDVYAAWFDEHIAETLSQRDALGIGRIIETSLKRGASASAIANVESGSSNDESVTEPLKEVQG